MKPIIVLLLVLLSFDPADAGIRPEYSGAWYNPGQSGHGLSIEVLDDERTIAFWFAYTPDGLPMFLVIDGVNDYDTVTGPAYAYEGMIWREFDPATLQSEVWGEISIEFLGCNRAVLNWSSGVEGYGDGQVELERLTSLAGLQCDDVPAEMTGEWLVGFTEPGGDPGPYTVMIEADGSFEFYDALACLWEGSIHVVSPAQDYLTARFGSPTCPWPVPMLDATGQFYATGITICGSGGACVSYDQAIALVSEMYEQRMIELRFLR